MMYKEVRSHVTDVKIQTVHSTYTHLENLTDFGNFFTQF